MEIRRLNEVNNIERLVWVWLWVCVHSNAAMINEIAAEKSQTESICESISSKRKKKIGICVAAFGVKAF